MLLWNVRLRALWAASYRNTTFSVRNVRMALKNRNHHLLSLSYNSRVSKDNSAFLLKTKPKMRKFLDLQQYRCEKLRYRCFIFLASRLKWRKCTSQFMLADQVMFRYIRKIAKSDYMLRHVCLIVRPPAWNNSGPIGRIVIKFDVQVFFKLCQQNSICVKIWQ